VILAVFIVIVCAWRKPASPSNADVAKTKSFHERHAYIDQPRSKEQRSNCEMGNTGTRPDCHIVEDISNFSPLSITFLLYLLFHR